MYYDNHADSHAGSPSASGAITLDAVAQLLSRPEATPRYVVQLCLSAAAVNAASVPRLDVFELYHLYCADARQANGAAGRALRLGFFKQHATAKVIARYLSRYFDSPHVVLVDPPEIVRALRHKFTALKDAGASPRRAGP